MERRVGLEQRRRGAVSQAVDLLLRLPDLLLEQVVDLAGFLRSLGVFVDLSRIKLMIH